MAGVTRLDPATVAARPLEPDGAAMARTASLFEPGLGLSAGIWEAEPFTEQIDAYPVDEICVVLEGTIRLRYAAGGVDEFGPGEAFAIAAGTECTWEQDDRVRKIYVIRERAE